MASKNSTANPPDLRTDPATKRDHEDERGGWAGVGVEIDARVGYGYVLLTYRGTVDALLTAGCLTPSMMANRAARPRGGRPQRDEHGQRFSLHRSPTKCEPGRMKLQRRGDPGIAMQLPGMTELFPEGLAAPVQDDPPQNSEPAEGEHWWPATARAWKENQLDYLGSDLRIHAKMTGDQWRGLSRVSGPRFRLAEGDLNRMEAIMHRFSEELLALLQQATVIDSQASPRPSFLRLVVDNTREGASHA
jgi:hypothetical protein